jgi:hypothetical protein
MFVSRQLNFTNEQQQQQPPPPSTTLFAATANRAKVSITETAAVNHNSRENRFHLIKI